MFSQLYEADSEGKLPIHEIATLELLFKQEKPLLLIALNHKSGRQLILYAAEKKLPALVI